MDYRTVTQKTRTPCEITTGGRRVNIAVPSPFQLCVYCERPMGDSTTVSPTPIETDDARFDAWSQFLQGWALSYPCRLALYCTKDPTEGGYYLRVAFAYPDERDSRDGVTPLSPTMGLWPPSLLPDEETPRWLRANLIYHLVHELDEHLRLDGVVVFDPHINAHYVCQECVHGG